jgi:hypothetical protein
MGEVSPTLGDFPTSACCKVSHLYSRGLLRLSFRAPSKLDALLANCDGEL